MNRRTFLTGLLASPSAYAAAPPQCTPLKPTANRYEFNIKIVPITEEGINRACSRITSGIIYGYPKEPPTDRQHLGCHYFNEKTNTLTLFVVEPRCLEDTEAFATIGHELWHGVKGFFHA